MQEFFEKIMLPVFQGSIKAQKGKLAFDGYRSRGIVACAAVHLGRCVEGLIQEVLDDFRFRFFFGQTQRHELRDFFASNFANGRFVDERGVFAGGFDAGNCLHFSVAHDNGVALHVAVAGSFADNQRVECLRGVVLSNGAADYLNAAPSSAFVSRTVELTPRTCTISISQKEFSSRYTLVVGFRMRSPVPSPSP